MTAVPDEIEAILVALARHGFDFGDYRREVLARRIEARLAREGAPEAKGYRELVERDPAAAASLAAELLVRYTRFFRDAAVFEAISGAVLPRLAAPGRALRAWVAGVATGEEAFSVAMLLALAEERTGCAFDVLATDRDAPALAVARAARYRDDAVASVGPALRDRFFLPDGDGWRVAQALRDRVRLVEHDFLGPRLAPREAVVPSFDLVLLRNVQLYLDERSRALVGARLAAVVREGGALVLGHVESLEAGTDRPFEPFPGVDPELRIFRRRDA